MSLTAPVTSGYSAFWQITGDKVAYAMSQSQGRAKDAKRIARVIRGFPTRDVVGALAVLLGAAPGVVFNNTYAAVPVPAGPSAAIPQVTGIADLGGLRPSVAMTTVNRASTAADATELKKWFSNALLEAGITYPTYLGSSVMRGTMHANMPGFS